MTRHKLLKYIGNTEVKNLNVKMYVLKIIILFSLIFVQSNVHVLKVYILYQYNIFGV